MAKKPRYIDADALYMDVIHKYDCCDDFLEMIEAMPTADVRENVHGKWIEWRHPHDAEPIRQWVCNKCENLERRRSRFCPNCGADMQKGEKMKSIQQTLEETAEEICNNYCKWPDLWGEEKEGMELCESDICLNCPLSRL